MWHVWGRSKVHTGFWWVNLRRERSFGRPRHIRENNVIKDHKELGWEYKDSIDPAQNWDKLWLVVNTVIEHAVQ
jgi:hypothetical protein